MGSGRGGAYSYDWIENLLGLNRHSAGEILPEYQDIKAGDELPLGGADAVMRVEVADPPRALFYLLFMEPGSLVMERKMLLGIKRRAEHGEYAAE